MLLEGRPMSLGWRPRNILLGMTLCLLLPVSVRTAPAAEDRADVATVVSRLNSGKEQIRRSAIPLIEWEQGHDEEYVAALGGLIEAAVRRPALDSAFGAVLKLADCPLPAASDTIAKALSAADWRLAMMAVDILGQRRADDHAAAIREIWDRPDARRSYALRHAVVCSLGEIGGPRSVGESVNLLPNLDGQLQYEAVARLSRRTGAKHGSDAVAWKEWWTAQDGKVPEVPVAKDDPLPQDLPWQRTVPRFFHVPIYSNRVVFVLDRSQSMLSTLRGKTRLEAMQEEFAKVVRQLPEASSFGLIVFNDRVEIWKNKLVA